MKFLEITSRRVRFAASSEVEGVTCLGHNLVQETGNVFFLETLFSVQGPSLDEAVALGMRRRNQDQVSREDFVLIYFYEVAYAQRHGLFFVELEVSDLVGLGSVLAGVRTEDDFDCLAV